MTIAVLDATGASQTIQTLDDLAKGAGTTSAATQRHVVASDDGQFGGVTETAPATDTASSGLNGRLQRIAQRITSLIALVPTSLGAKTAVNSFAVTLATDDAAVTTLGAKTDSKSTATDTTSISMMQVLKQVSASVQLMVFGGGTKAAAQRMTIATDDSIAKATEGDYETVAASQTDQVLGATGATGDYLSALLIIPATTSPGAVSIKDGSGSAITVFTGGSSSVSNLVPFLIPLGMVSTGGAWKVTTGANVSAIGIGSFA